MTYRIIYRRSVNDHWHEAEKISVIALNDVQDYLWEKGQRSLTRGREDLSYRIERRVGLSIREELTIAGTRQGNAIVMNTIDD